MHDEAGFLSAIRETPADDTARLVFADWLDEQDDPTCKTKAAFIRLELRLAGAPDKNLSRSEMRERLEALATMIEPGWLVTVSHPKLEACQVQSQFECPKQWAHLKPTDDLKVRFCDACKKNVHYCDTLTEARNHAANGNCVALTVALARRSVLARPPQPPPPKFFASSEPQLTRDAIAIDPPEQLPQPVYLALAAFDCYPDARVCETTRSVPAVWKRNRRESRCRNRNIQRENWEDKE